MAEDLQAIRSFVQHLARREQLLLASRAVARLALLLALLLPLLLPLPRGLLVLLLLLYVYNMHLLQTLD